MGFYLALNNHEIFGEKKWKELKSIVSSEVIQAWKHKHPIFSPIYRSQISVLYVCEGISISYKARKGNVRQGKTFLKKDCEAGNEE